MTTHEDFLRDALGFAMEAPHADAELRTARLEQVNLELLVHGFSPATNGQNDPDAAPAGKLVELNRAKSPEYLKSLVGSIGAEPLN